MVHRVHLKSNGPLQEWQQARSEFNSPNQRACIIVTCYGNSQVPKQVLAICHSDIIVIIIVYVGAQPV
jgi:hypothetical protein